jgi:hypothetical protein
MIENTRRRIPADHPVQALFRQLTERGMGQLDLHDADTIQYVTNLLVDFIEVDNIYRIKDDSGRKLQYIFEILDQASQTVSPTARCEHYRYLGDMTLYSLGLFPESLTYGRRSVSPEYYAEQGRRSYAIVAEMERPGRTVVFRKLSDQFERCVEGLKWVRLYIRDPFFQYMFREFQIT